MCHIKYQAFNGHWAQPTSNGFWAPVSCLLFNECLGSDPSQKQFISEGYPKILIPISSSG